MMKAASRGIPDRIGKSFDQQTTMFHSFAPAHESQELIITETTIRMLDMQNIKLKEISYVSTRVKLKLKR